MARRAIAVDEENGYYQFALGADPVPFSDIRKETAYLAVVEPLMGWEPWRYAVKTDRGVFFVDGHAEPREFGQEPEDEEVL